MRLVVLLMLLFPGVAMSTPPAELLVRLDRVQIDQMGKAGWLNQCRQGNSSSRCHERLQKALRIPATELSSLRALDEWKPRSAGFR